MEMQSSSTSTSEVASTEGSVTAFMEILVDPVLHLNLKNAPTVEQQTSVAKQIHAVVLLYNYYQRKRHPELEYLGFESFCKLAVTLRPSMMPYLNNKPVSDGAPEYQLTLTEEAIKDACNLCLALDSPIKEEWPISKVVVLLIDSGEENCVLIFGSVTQGVWSFLEKSLDNCKISSGSTVPNNKKRRRISKNNLGNEQNASEAGHEQLAFSAVKESTGINEDELTVLENHVVYSLSKEKSFVRFYIVKCRGTIKGTNKETYKVPIKEVLQSLQGPLVENCIGTWTATSVAEHLHLLPYAGVIFKFFSSESTFKEAYLEEWHKRTIGDMAQASQELIHEGLQRTRATQKLPNDTENEMSSSCFDDLGVGVSFSNSKSVDASGAIVKSPMKEYNNRSDMDGPAYFVSRLHNMKTFETTTVYGHKEDDCMAGKVYQHHKKRNLTKRDRIDFAIGVKNMVEPTISKCKDEKFDTLKMKCGNVLLELKEMAIGDDAVLPFEMNNLSLEKVQFTLQAKDKELFMAALRVLLRKRHKLARQLQSQSRQLRSTGDEIAICDKNIRTILYGGGNDLPLKIETLIDYCNEESELEVQGDICQLVKDQVLFQQMKEKSISEAMASSQSSCQVLDQMCHDNHWTSPTYHVSPSDGGYMAYVTVKGEDCHWSFDGGVHSSPATAIDLAAAQMIANLQILMPK